MGAGTNVQTILIALHDLDCPWRPADLTQRLGRIVRQGNMNKDIVKDIFESRIEMLASLTIEEKESLDRQKNEIKIEDYIRNLTDEQKEKASLYIDEVMTEVYSESTDLNEKYYRYGFSDGVNAILTSFEI